MMPAPKESGLWFSSHPEEQVSPRFTEVGLSNTVIFPGRGKYSLFDGEEVTERVNVILKLKTRPDQPDVEIDAGVYKWIDEEHLIAAVRFWKKRDHPSLRGIRFPDIDDVESVLTLSDIQRQENEEKYINSWKHLTTKPYRLLERYHNNYLQDHGLTSEDWVDSEDSDE